MYVHLVIEKIESTRNVCVGKFPYQLSMYVRNVLSSLILFTQA